MLPEKVQKVHAALKCSPYWKDDTSQESNKEYFRRILCPDCMKPEAFLKKEKPWLIVCPRDNKCGSLTKTRDLFNIKPFSEFEHKPTKSDPHFPATVYLKEERSLEKSIKDLVYRYEPNARNTGSGAIMFRVGVNSSGDKIWNGRIFNPPEGEDKGHNTPGGKIVGMIWVHPGIKYDPNERTFVTEGVINALSYIEMGFQAIAILTSSQDPASVDLSAWKKKVYAYDNDPAGRKATKRWMDHDKDADAILLPPGIDSNDLLLSQTPADARKYIDKKYSLFQFYANLARVDSADDYLKVFWGYHGYPPGLFVHEGKYFWGTVKEGKEGVEFNVKRVSNFTCETRYFELTDQNPDEPENRYALRVNPVRGRHSSCVVTAADLSAPAQMTKMFLQRSRVLWEGDRAPTMALIRRLVEAKAPVVRQAQSTGFDPASNWYVFPNFAIDTAGQMKRPNKMGFFGVTTRNLIKPAIETDTVFISPKKGVDPKEIYSLIDQAWPLKGPTVLAWTVASWWVNQIKAEIGFFPHASLWRDSQTGKSNLAITLNRIQCVDSEGIPLNKSTTMKGIVRKIGRRSGLMVGLLESGNEKTTLNYADLILTTYNINPLQTRAKTTNDLQTHDIEMRAALLFVQNREPFRSKPEKERVISVPFLDTDINQKTKEAFFKLKKVPPTSLAWVYTHVMSNREYIDKNWYKEFEKAKKDLDDIGDARIVENHAIVLAFHRMLCKVLDISTNKIDDDFNNFLFNIGDAKRIECSMGAGAIAETFFDILNQLEMANPHVQASMMEKDGMLIVNLPGIMKVMTHLGFSQMNTRELQDELKSHPAYIMEKSGKAYRFIDRHGTVPKKGWCFDPAKCKNKE